MLNKIYEFGGIADVLIKCKTAREIGGVTYKEHEPYTMLKDVNVQFTYQKNLKNSTGKQTVLSTQFAFPDSVIIQDFTLTQKICDLLLTKSNAPSIVTYNETATCSQGKVYLHKTPVNAQIFVYDENLNAIDIEYDSDYNALYSNSLMDNSKYLIFYSIDKAAETYSLEVPTYGYFEVEIHIKGNEDQRTNHMYMIFPAASLVTTPDLNIYNGSIMNSNLVFDLIYTNQPKPLIVLE